MTSILQMMRFKQESLGPSDPSLFLPALVLCVGGSRGAKPPAGAAPPPQTGEAVALQGRVPAQPISLASDAVQGLINLDVVVTDNSGKAIPGLGPRDFTLLDNHQPQTIISFHEFDGISSKPDPPVVMILLIDTIKMPFDLAAFERGEVERFLGGTAVIWVSP